MFKQLQNKLLRFILFSISIILIGVFTLIFVVSYSSQLENNKEKIQNSIFEGGLVTDCTAASGAGEYEPVSREYLNCSAILYHGLWEAGNSTECGRPDGRGKDGSYTKRK